MIARTDLNTLPVDKGWAWVIAGGGFFSQAILIAGAQVRALLFVEILQMFNANITTGSLVFMFASLATSMASVVATHYIMPKLNERGCVFLGGIIASLLTLGASFAPNIGVFIAILTVKGIASGLSYVPSMTLIPQYFKRYRSRATIVPFCGASATHIIGPFIVRAVKEEYGIRGVYMLLSAVELHYCVIGLLLRPVSAYRFRPDDDTMGGKDTSAVKSPAPANSATNSHDLPTDSLTKETNGTLLNITSGDMTNDVEAAEALLDQDDVDEAVHIKTVPNIDQEAEGTHAVENSDMSTTALMIDRTVDGDMGTDIQHKKDHATDTSAGKKLSRWQTFYQASSLDTWGFRCMILSCIPGSATVYLINYLPTICRFQGASFDEAALLTTIRGAIELVSRISTGVIADTKVLPPSKLSLITLICFGLSCHLFRFATSMTSLIPMIIVTAMCLGTRGPMQTLVCVEVVGPKKFPQAYSLYLLVLTVSASLFNPSLGALVEATGSFVPVLHILGSCLFLSAGLLACLPLFVRLDVQRGRKK